MADKDDPAAGDERSVELNFHNIDLLIGENKNKLLKQL